MIKRDAAVASENVWMGVVKPGRSETKHNGRKRERRGVGGETEKIGKQTIEVRTRSQTERQKPDPRVKHTL